MTSLTQQQIEGLNQGAYDLASGYPDIFLPDDLHQIVITAIREARGESSLDQTREKTLLNAVRELLDLTETGAPSLFVTFSGSVALNRVFESIKVVARRRRCDKMTAIIAEPSIDLSKLLIAESSDMQLVAVEGSGNTAKSQVESLIEELNYAARYSPEHLVFVIIDSPTNPFGQVYDDVDLSKLASACRLVGAILVVDHCFLFAGVHFPQKIATIFQTPYGSCDWIGIWDTGKSLDIGGDKIGVIATGSDELSSAVSEALSVIQSGPGLRCSELFSRILASPYLDDYFKKTADLCHANLRYLQQAIPNRHIPTPLSSTFGCIFLPDGCSGDDARSFCLSMGVSVASGRTFFSTSVETRRFVRISLFRETEDFNSAIEKIKHLPCFSE